MTRNTLRAATIEELIDRARDGDDAALAELFSRSQPMLKRLRSERLARTPPSGAGPSDVAQEAAKRAFKGFSTFKGTTEGEWKVWLRKIFVNCLTELHRKASRQKRKRKGGAAASTESSPAAEAEEVPALEKSPSQAASHKEEWRRLLTSLYLLNAEEGTVIWLHHLQELTVSEVARLMGKNRPAVMRLLCSGLDALQSIMTKDVIAVSGETPAAARLSDETSAALSSYFSRRDAGEQVDKASFIAEHPGCADELRSFLEWIERIEAIWRRA